MLLPRTVEAVRTKALLLALAVTAGLLTWAVVPGDEQRCLWAITIGTERQGYVEIPCGLTVTETTEYLNDHPNLPFAELLD